MRPTHRPQLDCVERKRVEDRTLVAKHVGDLLKTIREAFLFVWSVHVALYARGVGFLIEAFLCRHAAAASIPGGRPG